MTAAPYQHAPCLCGCRQHVVLETREHIAIATASSEWATSRYAHAMNIAAEGEVEVLVYPAEWPPVQVRRPLRSRVREWLAVGAGSAVVAAVGYIAVVLVVAAFR